MKKLFALVFVFLIAFTCVACSGNTDGQTTTTTTSAPVTTTSAEGEGTSDADNANTVSTESSDYVPETTESTTIVENAEVPEYTLSGEFVKTENRSDITVVTTYTGVLKNDFVSYTNLLVSSGFKQKYQTFWIVEGTSALPEFELGNTSVIVSWNRASVSKGEMTITITRNDVNTMV